MERPIFWHHGLFLQPQHFQLSDRYVQSLLNPLYRFLMPHLWGIAEMKIQETALGAKNFQLLKGEFLFPDKTSVALPDNAVIESRYFEEDWVEGGKPFTVYLGLKKWNNTGQNVTTITNVKNLPEVSTRFISLGDFEEVKDLHQDGPSSQLKRLKFALRIFWETEQDRFGDYEIIPIAQLVRRGEEVVLSGNFIPPCLTINASEKLEKIIKEIRDQIGSRAYQLESFKRDRGIHTAEFGARDMVFLLALRSLNRYIPQLFHQTTDCDMHPWVIYGLLRQLIGELSSFSSTITVMGEAMGGESLVPKYQHQDLWTCFSSAQSIITRLLDEITAGPEYVFQLVYDGTYYSAELPPAIFEGKNRFYMVIETDQEPSSMIQSIESSAKLSSREALAMLIVRALPAIKLTHLQVPPQELPRRANALYFQVDHHSDQWSNMQKNRNVALFWDTAPEGVKVELMVVGKG